MRHELVEGGSPAGVEDHFLLLLFFGLLAVDGGWGAGRALALAFAAHSSAKSRHRSRGNKLVLTNVLADTNVSA
jgi:hypothetical protein